MSKDPSVTLTDPVACPVMALVLKPKVPAMREAESVVMIRLPEAADCGVLQPDDELAMPPYTLGVPPRLITYLPGPVTPLAPIVSDHVSDPMSPVAEKPVES